MFTKQQLDEIRAEYAKVELFPTHMLDPLRSTLSRLQPADLRRVAKAEIKFVSVIAQNMINEKKVKKS